MGRNTSTTPATHLIHETLEPYAAAFRHAGSENDVCKGHGAHPLIRIPVDQRTQLCFNLEHSVPGVAVANIIPCRVVVEELADLPRKVIWQYFVPDVRLPLAKPRMYLCRRCITRTNGRRWRAIGRSGGVWRRISIRRRNVGCRSDRCSNVRVELLDRPLRLR